MTGKVVHTSTVARREDCDEVGTMFLREPNVYIGRYYFWGAGRHFEESPFHNPYSVKKYGRDEALRRFEKYIRAPEQAHLRDRLGELKGKTLCCWCARKPDGDPNVPEVLTLKDPTICHGQILLRMIELADNSDNLKELIDEFNFEKKFVPAMIKIAVQDLGETSTYKERERLARKFLKEDLPGGYGTGKVRDKATLHRWFKMATRMFVKRQMEAVEAYWRDSRPGGPEDPDRTRTDRAIDKEVWDKRGYHRWPKRTRSLKDRGSKFYLSDVSAIEEAYGPKRSGPHKRDGLGEGQINYMKMLGWQSPGWVMTRYPVPGERHVYAEIRPDRPVTTGPPTRHWHGIVGEEPEELKANTGAQVMLRGTEAFRQHCRRIDKLNEGTDAPPHETVMEVHEHPDEAKYVFPPSPKTDLYYEHDHADDFYADNPWELAAHLKAWHSEPDLVEWGAMGSHIHKRRVKDHSNSLARRIDIHPMARDRLPEAELVYFVLEGIPKNDAVLSAIIREGRKESVFNVPSVSLWKAKELRDFARNHLKGKTVVIVPDADWIKNDMVIAHARACEIYLQKLELDCYVAAPPLGREDTVIHKGIDDYLAHGGSLDGLHVLERSRSPQIARERRLLEEHSDWYGRKLNRRSLDTAERLMWKLSHFATSEGVVKTSFRDMGHVMEVSPTTVGDRLEDLMAYGWIKAEIKPEDVWVPTTKVPKTVRRYRTDNGLFIYLSDEWRDSTRYIIPEKFRAIDHDPVPLGELRERLARDEVRRQEQKRKIAEAKVKRLEDERVGTTLKTLMVEKRKEHRKAG